MSGSGNLLHWSDWVMFVGMLVVSLGIGIYYALVGGKQKTTGEYLLGDRKMGVIPVTISMAVSYISTLTLLGMPAEMYAFGGQFWIGAIGGVMGAIGACIVFVPLFYPLKLVSVNEYLQLRYESRIIKGIGSFCTVTGTIYFSANALFGPSTAVEAVSGFSVYLCIAIGGIVCIIYTTLGGIKAVIWSDVFQSLIMLVGTITILIQGVIAMDGFDKVWELCGQWGRLDFFDFDPNPTKRLTFWGLTIGNGLSFMGIYGYIQMAVQRYSSLPTITKARISVIGAMPGMVLLTSLSCITGLTVFAYYAQTGCDPVKEGKIQSPNQILPYFIVQAGSIPLMSGLFVAALTAASLSSASSALNSSAAMLWADVIHPCLPNVKPAMAANLIKVLVIALGLVSIGIAFGLAEAGGTMLQIMGTFSAATGGPVAALYFMGAFVPWVNWKGATVGSLSAFGIGLWITFGSYTTGRNWRPLPSPTQNCSLTTGLQELYFNETSAPYLEASSPFPPEHVFNSTIDMIPMASNSVSGIKVLFQLSWLWMREFVMLVAIVVTIIVSGITGFTKSTSVNPRYLHPWTVSLLRLDTSLINPSEEMEFKQPLNSHDDKKENKTNIHESDDLVWHKMPK